MQVAEAAAAYGADGIDYFCWSTYEGYGSYNNTLPAQGGNRPQGSTYAATKEANGNLRVWGKELQAFKTLAAVYHTGWGMTTPIQQQKHTAPASFAVSPGDGIVDAMATDLMLGLKLPPSTTGTTAPAGFVQRQRRPALPISVHSC